ncbi:MAG: HNH endonuclease [Boseongicola sp. SB0662_bin_57]|nr:HNH endonuclease [Boseongicola sp. SB0662_bin_57]
MDVGLRRCIKEPIPEIFDAWQDMSAAVDAHVRGEAECAAQLFGKERRRKGANGLRVWHWFNPGWTLDVDDGTHIVEPSPRNDTSTVLKEMRDGNNSRIPGSIKRAVLDRDGHCCRYCGIPVVDAEIRKIAHRLYPDSVVWGADERRMHAGFAAMWLQFDHVVPWSHGGRTDERNVVVSCALCNFGKSNNTLKQLGLEDPRDRPPEPRADYDGLERLRCCAPAAAKS